MGVPPQIDQRDDIIEQNKARITASHCQPQEKEHATKFEQRDTTINATELDAQKEVGLTLQDRLAMQEQCTNSTEARQQIGEIIVHGNKVIDAAELQSDQKLAPLKLSKMNLEPGLCRM